MGVVRLIPSRKRAADPRVHEVGNVLTPHSPRNNPFKAQIGAERRPRP
jgi:hypothetical protein